MKKVRYRPNKTLKAVMSILAFVFIMGGVIGFAVNDKQLLPGDGASHQTEENTYSPAANHDISADSGKEEGGVVAHEADESTKAKNNNDEYNGQIEVHYIDVGQADSILIKCDGEYMLIDAGNNDDSDLVVDYVKAQGVTKINYLVGTHPHEDHIGGLDAVIDSFDIGTLYMPKATSTTKTFKDVVTSAQKKNLSFTVPVVGSTYMVGSAECTVLAPNSEKYDDTNDYSIVIRMVYKDTSFLFTGDAEAKSEKEMLANNLDLSADVLKVGHHGSKTSSSEKFLDAVNPKYAVISVGADNDYKHPNQSTLDRLKKRNIPVYRTDESGTIIATSDGRSVGFNVSPGSYAGKK